MAPGDQEKSSHPIRFLDLKNEYLSCKSEIDEAVLSVLKSGQYILGESVARFEQEFAQYLGVRYGVGVGSGTEALHLALLCCGIQPGDEVITTPLTAPATVLAISAAQATPVFVDVDTTYNLNPSGLQKAITSRTKVVLPVHLFGHPADLDTIFQIARDHNLNVVEDACQAHGSEYKNRKVGSFGKMGCFSFYPTKNLGAYGDAGMIVTNDQDIYKTLLMLRDLGRNNRFSHLLRGFNSRLDEVQAALLNVKLKHLTEWNAKRADLARIYRTRLASAPVLLPPHADYAKPNYHLFVIRTSRRDQLKEFLASREIETSIHYPAPVHLQPAYSDLGLKEGSFPLSEQYSNEVLSLPLNPFLQVADVERIAENIIEFFHSGNG